MQTIQSRRKNKLNPEEYRKKLVALTALIDSIPKLYPDRDNWDIEGDWSGTGTIYFIDFQYESLFEPFADFVCTTIKLANLGRPAVRITFFRKHRFWVLKEKQLSLPDKQQWVENYVNELYIKLQIQRQNIARLSGPRLSLLQSEIGQMQEQITAWNHVLLHMEEYELAVSNYQRGHFYCTMNYKYITRTDEFANADEHMLNPQKDRAGNITQMRYNVVFIDSGEIYRPHPHQHKEIDRFLARFPLQSQLGRQQLYARRRLEANRIDAFEQQKKMGQVETESKEWMLPTDRKAKRTSSPNSGDSLTLFE
ncbi:hypothetical protein [Spirosoma gilvum]